VEVARGGLTASPRDLTPRAKPSTAERILEIDSELEALREKRPTVAGVAARALVMGTLLVGSWGLLGYDSSENVLASVLFGVVVLWMAAFTIPHLERLQRRARLHREVEALIATPRTDPVSALPEDRGEREDEQ
jgi:hypothetical protein